MPSGSLILALTEHAELRPLPDSAANLVLSLDSPPRLAAHLRAVHQAARELTEGVGRLFPGIEFDREAVLFGAATHDIGKTIHVAELTGPGSAHERDGYQLLLDHGVEEHFARFAWTHAAWSDPAIRFEDLLVSLADKVWKAKRVEDLERLAVDRIVSACGGTPWQAFMSLDDVLTGIAAKADERLAFQARHPIAVRVTRV